MNQSREYKINCKSDWFNTAVIDPDIEDRGERVFWYVSPEEMGTMMEWAEGCINRKGVPERIKR